LNGGGDYAMNAQTALDWYARAIRLNPHDGYSWLRTGMCLDWLNQPAAATAAYHTAEALDPNGYFMLANIGWHYVQTGDYAAAAEWFRRSQKLGGDNPIARNYLAICEARLAAQATGKPPLPANY
jgi:Flp pilus assembly protein TadD